MQIQLYHLQHSRSQRIVWLLEELGLDYEFIVHQQSQAQHKYPLLILQNYKNEQSELSETASICHFLCEREKQLIIETNQSTYWNFCYFQHFADASLMPLLLMKQLYTQTAQRTPWLFRWVSLSFKYAINRFYLVPELHQHLHKIEKHFKDHTYVANHFSYADILLWFPLKACSYALNDFEQYPEIHRYLNQLENRPAFQSAQQKGQWNEHTFKNYWTITQ